MKNTSLKAPFVQAKPKEIITHNHVRVDNYYWLNEPKNPEVINYLTAENTYLDAVMTPVKTLDFLRKYFMIEIGSPKRLQIFERKLNKF